MVTTFKRTQDLAKGECLNAVAISDSTITLKSGHGDEFPSFPGNDYYVTLFGTTLDDGYEVCLCTGRSSDVLTVTRAQLGTSAQAWDVDDACQMIIQAQHFDDITGAINDLEDGTTEHAALNCDGNGLDVNPGSDIDADLITVGVTGAPKFWWDESEDKFVFSKDLIVTPGFNPNAMTVGDASNQKVWIQDWRAGYPIGASSSFSTATNKRELEADNTNDNYWGLPGPPVLVGTVVDQIRLVAKMQNASDICQAVISVRDEEDTQLTSFTVGGTRSVDMTQIGVTDYWYDTVDCSDYQLPADHHFAIYVKIDPGGASTTTVGFTRLEWTFNERVK